MKASTISKCRSGRNHSRPRDVNRNRMIRKLVLICLTCAAAASAQSLSVGVLGGAPFTDVVRNGNFVNNVQSTVTSSNYTVGPSIRVSLPLSLRLEVDA